MIVISSTWKGPGMKVTVRPSRGYERCELCQERFTTDLVCPTPRHYMIRPGKVYIDLYIGSEGRKRITRDSDGDPLDARKGLLLRERIEQEAKDAPTDREAVRRVLRKFVPRDRKRMKFSSIVAEYMEHIIRRHERKEVSRGLYLNAKGVFKEINYQPFWNIDIAEIRRGIVEDWLDKLDASTSAKQKRLVYLRMLLNWAHSREYVDHVPKFPVVKHIKQKKPGLTAEQQYEILSHIPSEHKPIFEFAVATGRRINEYRALKVKDLDYKRGVYVVSGAFDIETYKPYPKVADEVGTEYPLTKDLKQIIARALHCRDIFPDSFVFERMSRKKMHPYRHDEVSRIFKAAKIKAGYPHVELNTFGRHSMGWQLMEVGASITEISGVLGHKNIGTTMNHYTHMQSARKLGTLKKLEKAAPKQRKKRAQ